LGVIQAVVVRMRRIVDVDGNGRRLIVLECRCQCRVSRPGV